MPKVGMVLSGCGVMDGTEIHEATLLMLHLVKNGAEVVFMAPDIQQTDTVNHITGQPVAEEGEKCGERNVLKASARIARGNIKDISDVQSSDIDALVFPGGLGACKNLSDYAFHDNVGDIATELHVTRLIEDMLKQGKPMGFMCIAPASIAAVAMKDKGLKLTIGNDVQTAGKIRQLGHEHVDTSPTDVVVDVDHKVVSTPAYMLAKDIVEVDMGVGKFVRELLKLAN